MPLVRRWQPPAPRSRRRLPAAAVVVLATLLLAGLGIAGIGGTPPPAAEAAPVCALPRCKDVSMPVPTGVRVASNKVRILLPKNYATSKLRYPVVYLLHGRGNRYTAWSLSTDLIAYSANFPAIFVMPDGGANATAGWNSDWADGAYQYETFQTKVLMPWVDKTFRTKRGVNAIVGNSMGGTGALGYAARHPGLFRAVASFSGVVDTATNPYLPTTDPLLIRIWGDPVTNADVWAEHNPLSWLPPPPVEPPVEPTPTPTPTPVPTATPTPSEPPLPTPTADPSPSSSPTLPVETPGPDPGSAVTPTPDPTVRPSPTPTPTSAPSPTPTPAYTPAAKLPATGLFLAWGTGTASTTPGVLGSWENFVHQQHQVFVAGLNRAGIAHSDYVLAGAQHSWGLWQKDLHWALPKMMKLLV